MRIGEIAGSVIILVIVPDDDGKAGTFHQSQDSIHFIVLPESRAIKKGQTAVFVLGGSGKKEPLGKFGTSPGIEPALVPQKIIAVRNGFFPGAADKRNKFIYICRGLDIQSFDEVIAIAGIVSGIFAVFRLAKGQRKK